jgi:hypothetical protein
MGYKLRYLGKVNGSFTATTGTINCGNAKEVKLQVFLDANSAHEIAVKPTTSLTATASKANCAAVITDNGVYEAQRPAGAGAGTWYLRYTVFNGASRASATSSSDKYSAEKLG